MAFGMVYGGVYEADRRAALLGLFIPILMLYFGALYFRRVKWSYLAWIGLTLSAGLNSLYFLAQ